MNASLLPAILSLWFAAQPPVDARALAPADADASDAARRTKYDAAQAELRAAEVQGDNEIGPASCARLEAALSDVEQYGDLLVNDDEGRETWMYARLTLVRNYYGQSHDNARANALLEDTLRKVSVPKYILDKFHPYFGDKVDKLRAKLEREGQAQVRVVCHTECSVAVNRMPVDAREIGLYLGKHVVSVRAVDGSVDAEDFELELKKKGQVETVEFGTAPAPEVLPGETEPQPEPEPEPAVEGPQPEPEPEITEPQPEPEPVEAAKRRKLPRWAGLTGTAVGIAAAVAGAVILSYNGKCPGGLDPVADRPDCPKVYNAKPAGYGLIVGGAAIAGTFGAVLLPIGETRDRKARGAQAMVSYTLRF